MSSPPPMLMLLLVNGFTPTELSASLGKLKSETKNIGTHNLRQLYYKSYQDIQKDISKYSNVDDVNGGKLYGLVKYYRNYGDDNGGGGGDDDDDDSTAKTEFEEFTKRQKALVNTPKVFMGRHIRLLVDADDNDSPAPTTNSSSSGNEFFMPWFGEEAEVAYLDITSGEECISIDSDRGVYISTRVKRKNCISGKPSTSAMKSIDGLIDYITTQLQPDKSLQQSISWSGHNPPTPNNYNVILTGTWPNSITQYLPTNIAGYTNTTSMYEIYDLFEQRRNQQYIHEAEILISRMLTEIAKQHGSSADNSTSVHTGSMKDLVCAKRNSLLKRVYIDSSKTKFIQNAKNDDGGFELIVVHSRKGSDTGQFEEYGGVVFETFYKLDLSIYG